jgi:hypothetical protein
MARLPYSKGSVERALNHHQSVRNIQDWRPTPSAGPDYRTVTLFNGDRVELRTLREAYLLALGLASASGYAIIRAARQEGGLDG